jgi:hypothetical protein
MTPAENAFNHLYPAALRVAALHRRIEQAEKEHDDELICNLIPDLRSAIRDLLLVIDAIEAGQISDSLSTSIAGVLNQMRRGAQHN